MILAQIAENKNDRIEIQKQVDKQKLEGLKTVLPIVTAYVSTDPKAQEQIASIQNEEVNAVGAMMILANLLGNDPALITALNNAINSLTTKINSVRPGGFTLIHDAAGMIANPKKFAGYIIKVGLGLQAEFGDPKSIYYQLDKDKDLYKFIYKYNKLVKPTAPNTQLETLLGMLVWMDSLTTIRDLAISNVDNKKLNAAQLEVLQPFLLEDATLAPSTQQLLALNDLLFSYFNNGKEWENVLILKGVLGSGKSLVGAKMFIDILRKLDSGLNEKSIVAFGHSTHSSANIATSLFGDPTKASSIDRFQNQDLKGVKLVVVDEAMAMPNEDWSNPEGTGIYDRVDAHNKKNPTEQIKILALGDASQITVEHPDLTTIGAITHTRTKDTSPLSVIYRTSISAISDTALTFKDQPTEITSISTTATMSLVDALASENTDNLYGVLGVMGQGPLEILKTLISKPTAKSKVVIVNNATAKTDVKAFLGNIPNVEILTYYEAQSRQWDQVYIHMDKFAPDFKGGRFSELEFNNAMYTMVGRAKEFVFMATPNIKASTIVNPQLKGNRDDNSRDLAENKAYLEDYLDTLADLNDTTLSKKQAAASDMPNDDDAETDQTEQPWDKVPNEPEDPKAKKDKEDKEDKKKRKKKERQQKAQEQVLPTENEAIKQAEQLGELIHSTAYPSSTVDLETFTGKKAHIIRVSDGKSKVGEYSYYVVAKNDENDRYVTLAVLGEKDFMDSSSHPTGSLLLETILPKSEEREILSATRGLGGVNVLESGFEMTPEISAAIVSDIDIEEGQNLSYSYEGTPTSRTIRDLLIRFWTGFFDNSAGGRGRTPEKSIFTSADQQSIFKSNAKVAIFSHSGRSDDPYTLDKPM